MFKLHGFSPSVCVLWNGFLFSYLTVYCLACACYLTLAKQGRASQAQAELEPLHLYRCVYIVMIYIPYTLQHTNIFCVPKYASVGFWRDPEPSTY